MQLYQIILIKKVSKYCLIFCGYGRAKLFLSFDALRGFRSYIKEKERVVVQRPALSEDDYFVLDRKIHYIEKGMVITIVYYDKGEYVRLTGMVAKIDLDYSKSIRIVNDVIPVKKIVEIQCEGYCEIE